ncbi:MAG: c-type cytochrome [Deltaproteobacteria bacterium]|nr:c-type cytochrome [Deltaproteobacteria bacterium]
MSAPAQPKGRLARVGEWLDFRLKFRESILPPIAHPVPKSSASWWYVFGSATLLCFVVQIVTGMCLALVYVPSASEAWTSLEYLNYVQPFGWFLRSLHSWGSNFMVTLMTIHLVQVYLFGAYKYPRELTWVVGCVLFLCTLGMAFTGQVMRFDQDAYWGLGIGVAMMGRFPVIGESLVHLVLGGPIIGAETLSRFFTLHVFAVPGLLLMLIGVHLWLVIKVGINEWPMPGRLVTRERYSDEYHELVAKEGEPFVPQGVQKDIVFAGIVLVALFACAAVFGPAGPNGQPDPTLIETVPRPDFFFLSLFAVFALLPPYLETPLILTAPVVLVALAFLLPFYSNTGEKSWKRRPGAWILVIVVFLCLGTLTWLGLSSPWSPDMSAWSGTPTPVEYVKGRTPLELQGALVFQAKQCRNCHSLGGEGGMRGPALDDVATVQTRDEIVRQVLQGDGNMPAYGKNLKPQEVTALVAFLTAMHPAGEPAQRSATIPARPGG